MGINLTLLTALVLVIVLYTLYTLSHNAYSDQMKRRADELARGKRD